MKTKIILILNIFVIFFGGIFLIQQIFFEKDPNIKLIIKLAIVFLTYSVAVGRYIKLRLNAHRTILYNQYIFLFRGAFPGNKKKSSELFSVARFINNGNYDKAYNQLEKIKKECRTIEDNSATLLLESLCLIGKCNYNTAMSVLDSITAQDPQNATAWAFISLLYQRFGLSSSLALLIASISYNNLDKPELSEYYITSIKKNGEDVKKTEKFLNLFLS